MTFCGEVSVRDGILIELLLMSGCVDAPCLLAPT
jgi:hypothetical protein